jgi:mono/diheme cytochrome c family protein
MSMRAWGCSIATVMALFGAHPASATPAEVWASTCTYCHDAGIALPIFGRKLTHAAIAAVVRNGTNGMPAFHPSEISDAQLELLVEWVSRQPPAKPAH